MQTTEPTKTNYISIAAACFMIQAVGVGTFVTYGVFFSSLHDEFQWSRAVISGASSFAFFLSGLFAIIVGRLNDLYGPRKLMSVASLLFGVGFISLSQVTEVWQLYVYYGLIFGIGLSAVDVIALTTTARWFSRSRGLMTGIVKVGTGAGQFSIPFLASLLIGAYGWRSSSVIIGSGSLLILFMISQVLKPNPEHETRNNLNKISQVEENKFTVALAKDISVKGALATKQMWLLCFITLITVYCLLTVLVHIVPHANDLGLPAVQAAGVLSTIGAVSMVGRFICGIAIDRLGCKPIMLSCFLVLFGSLLLLKSANSVLMLYTFAAVYGLAHGGYFTVISPIVAEIFGVSAHGALFGIIVFSGTTGGSVGPIIAGQIFDTTGTYSLVFTSLVLLSLLAFVLTMLVAPIKNDDVD